MDISTCQFLTVTQNQNFELKYFLLCFSNESIGVTTGRAFCGVVGHRDRHEYTGTLLLLYSIFFSFSSIFFVRIIFLRTNPISRFTNVLYGLMITAQFVFDSEILIT